MTRLKDYQIFPISLWVVPKCRPHLLSNSRPVPSSITAWITPTFQVSLKITSLTAQSLTWVAIFHTSIRSVPKMDYICNTLTHLVLSENVIVDIQALYNITFPVLRILDLAGNRLTSIKPDLMMFPVIHNIMFIENLLTEVPNFVQSTWGRSLPGDDITYLAIGRGNPWNCTTAMVEKLDGMSSVSTRIEIKKFKGLDLSLSTCCVWEEYHGCGWDSDLVYQEGASNTDL